MNKTIIFIILNSILLACGILMIFINCIIYQNWWPVFSIVVFCGGLCFPILCNACSLSASESDMFLFDTQDSAQMGGILSWLLFGICITIGYGIPIELWRVHTMSLTPMFLTIGGGTVILAAILIFVKVIEIKKDSSSL